VNHVAGSGVAVTDASAISDPDPRYSPFQRSGFADEAVPVACARPKVKAPRPARQDLAQGLGYRIDRYQIQLKLVRRDGQF